MPQMNKGGKFIFGKSIIHEDGTIQFPLQAIEEYRITSENKIYLFTGSKKTGGFCVTRRGLFYPSKIGHILQETPSLLEFETKPGEFVKYKGRYYCWLPISIDGKIKLNKDVMNFLEIIPNMELLSIRSSNIAFTMGAKGPLLEKAKKYKGEIPVF